MVTTEETLALYVLLTNADINNHKDKDLHTALIYMNIAITSRLNFSHSTIRSDAPLWRTHSFVSRLWPLKHPQQPFPIAAKHNGLRFLSVNVS